MTLDRCGLRSGSRNGIMMETSTRKIKIRDETKPPGKHHPGIDLVVACPGTIARETKERGLHRSQSDRRNTRGWKVTEVKDSRGGGVKVNGVVARPGVGPQMGPRPTVSLTPALVFLYLTANHRIRLSSYLPQPGELPCPMKK